MPRRTAREPHAAYLAAPSVLVDSNVLIDVLEQDRHWFDWSAAQLAATVDNARAVINPIIYAEIATDFATLEDLERALAPFDLRREALPWDSAFLAAKAYKLYRARGGARSSPLPDFYIGAHASLAGFTLLTRDARRYREYFPKLRLISPA